MDRHSRESGNGEMTVDYTIARHKWFFGRNHKIALALLAIFHYKCRQEIMRYIYSSIFVLCFAPFVVAQPFVAVITADGTAVRSGPGIEFYPTLQLRSGDKVEIYYEQGEWCAIRPPIGSFSWVSAQFVDFGTGNIGTVLANGLASRIGSDDSDDCDTVQVTLKKGESVFILDRRETPENTISPVWLKIAPPNGEFRWIHRSALQSIREPATLSPPIQQVQYTTTPALPKVASAHPFGTAQSTSTVNPFQRAFNELQREAYIVMTRPADDEVFGVLIQRAHELHQIAPTDHDLERTYHLLESLQRTRTVRRELALRRPRGAGTFHREPGTVSPVQQVSQAYTPTSAQSHSQPPIPAGSRSPLLRAGVNVGGYDVVGLLGEFDNRPPEHPPFAIADENEKVICMISPAANIDLSRLVGQFVGINGVLGEYRQPGKPNARHVTARHVWVLR